VWPITPHTSAKHAILENYLKAWFPILARWSDRIIYLDGFAGPGIYAGEEEGSPVIAVRTAINHRLLKQFRTKIVFYFIEKDRARAAKLKEVLEDRFPRPPKEMIYEVEGAEFAPTLEHVLDQLEKQGAKLAPTFAFLDPFGFSGLPMNLIRRLMSYDKCEVLITFMLGFIKRFADELRQSALNEFFGTNEWRNVRTIADPRKAEMFLQNLYERQLREVCGAKHVRSFGMIGEQNQLIYYLVYGTKHWKGLEVMKDAMWRVDRRGIYTFSDLTGGNQTFLIDYQDDVWLPNAAEKVFDKFRGRTVEIDSIKEFVITDTRYRFRKSILRYLEREKPPKIIGVTGVKGTRKKLTYPDECRVTFARE